MCVHLDNLNRKIRTICCFDKTVRLCGNESKTNSHTRKLLWWKFQIIVKIHWVSCAFSDCQWKIKTQRWRNMDNVTPCDNKIISRNKINESWQQYKKKMKFIRWTLIYKRSRNINNSVWKLQTNAPKRSEWTIIISVMCARDGNNTYVSISTTDECKHLRWISWSKSHHCMEQWIFFVEFRLTRERERK